MANKVILSEQFKFKALDFINGLVIAVGTPLLYLGQEMIPGWDAHPVVKAALSATITYLIKKYVEKPKVTTTYSSNAKATEVSKDIKEAQ